APRAALHAVLPGRRLPAVRAPLAARRVGRQAGARLAPATRAALISYVGEPWEGSPLPLRVRGVASHRSELVIRTVCLGLLLVALTGAAPATGSFERGVREGRVYRVWVPARVQPARPLVVALHGCWQTPEDFALGTRLNAAAEARGLVVVYPAQS